MPNLVSDLQAAIHTQALPFLAQANSSRGFVEVAKWFWRNPHAPKKAAFVLARAGEYDRAVALINEYLPALRLDSHWEKDIFDVSTVLRDLLVHDPQAADRQLQQWEDYTTLKLRLEAFQEGADEDGSVRDLAPPCRPRVIH